MRTTCMMTERGVDVALRAHRDAVATGERISWARGYACLSLEELAAFAGLSRRTLRRIELGERVMTGAERAAVARGLGVSLAFLAIGNGNGKAASR